MAVLMSVGFAVPVFYACQMQGSFFVFWLSWLISLADGIGERSCFAFWVFDAHVYAAAASKPSALGLHCNLHDKQISEPISIIAIRCSCTSDLCVSLV